MRASVQSDISNWNTGDVAQWLERLNSIQRTWFSIPWRGRIREENMSLRVNSCAELFAPDSPSCVRHAPEFVRTLSRAICRKTAGLTAGGKVSQNTVYTRLGINYGWVARLCRIWLSSGNATRIPHGENSHWDSKLHNNKNQHTDLPCPRLSSNSVSL